jgi:hypothetical protein
MRRTMFAVTGRVAAIVDASCTRALSAVQHARLAKQLSTGAVVPDPAAWIEAAGHRVVSDLHRNGPATTRELVRRMPELDIRFTLGDGRWAAEVGIASRLLFLLAVDGRVVRARPTGTWLSSQYRWEAGDGGSSGPQDVASAVERLVDLWLRRFGPGTLDDIAWWTGLTRRAISRALDAVGAETVELDDGVGWTARDDDDWSDDVPDWVALLPALDSTVMGWRGRDWYLDAGIVPDLFDRNGNAGPTVWSNGRVVGGWGQHRDGTVAFEFLEQVAATTKARVADEAGRLTEWLGGTVVTPRFPTPLWKRLSAR